MPVWWCVRLAIGTAFVSALIYAMVEALSGIEMAHTIALSVAVGGAVLTAAMMHVRIGNPAPDIVPLPVSRAPLSVGLGLATVLSSLAYFEMAQWGFDGIDHIVRGEATWGTPGARTDRPAPAPSA